MSKFDRLIAEFCPDGVEYVALGKIASVGVGQAPANISEGDIPFVNAGTTPSGFLSDSNTEPGRGGILPPAIERCGKNRRYRNIAIVDHIRRRTH